jgi:arylsulfatase A-like enzyme
MKDINHSLLILIVFTTLLSCKYYNKSTDEKKDVKRPNIIVMLTDDQRWDALGFAGNKLIKTPNIDALANKGIYFKNAFVTTPICCASRANVLTGQYASRNGVHDFFTPIALETTYPAILRDNGYYTGFVGKWGTLETDTTYFEKSAKLFDFWAGSMGQANFWHESDCNYVNNNGTTDKLSFYCNCPADKRGVTGEGIRVGKHGIKNPVHLSTEVIPHKMRQFLNQMDVNKPFCMSISFKAPHSPWTDFDRIYKDFYEGEAMPVAESVNLENALSRPEFLRVSLNGNNMIESVKTKGDIEGKLQNSMRNYYRLIDGLDSSVGQIMEELKKRNLHENTVIIFLSDNGQFMAEHGFHGKWLMYEESIRVPFFIYDPRRSVKSENKVSDDMVLSIDVAPTVLEYAGLKIPNGMQGKSLANLKTLKDSPLRDAIFVEHMYGHGEKENHIERSWAVRTKDWKYIKYKDQTGPVSEELYYLKSDSLEMEDLSTDKANQDILVDFRQKLKQYLITTK